MIRTVSVLLLIACCNLVAAQNTKSVFTVVPLGIYGSAHESNLSAYMIAPANSNEYVCLDAGTLYDGIEKAIQQKSFSGAAAAILKKNIRGYLISHPHLDHVAGLIINSPDDTAKNIYALPFCINTIAEKYFSWKSWANFGDEGETPLLKKYHYVQLQEVEEIALAQTTMFVRAFELSHSNPYKSTAFLIRHDSSYILYFGDTGADTIEKSNKLNLVWHSIAPLIQRNAIKGIFIEVSFPDEQPAGELFGHLTPKLLFAEMQKLASLSGIKNLQQVPVVVTHIKPTGNNEALIKKELAVQNELHLQLVFPQQGKIMKL